MSTIFNWQTETFDDLLKSCQWDPLTPYLHRYFPSPGPILEAGCGAGRFVKYMHDEGFDCRGIEFNEVTVKNVKAKWPELQIVQGDVERMFYADNTFKGVLSVGLIEHFEPGPETVLAETWRVLEPGGIGLITVPCLNGLRRLKGPFCGIHHMIRVNPLVRTVLGKKRYERWGWNLYGSRFKYHVWPEWGEFYEYRFKPREFEQFLRAARFEILESVPLDQTGGMYHEFGRFMAKWEHCKIELYPHAKVLHRLFSMIPFFHNHMHLWVVRKKTER
jgi:SAM-dependent methyltransferase